MSFDHERQRTDGLGPDQSNIAHQETGERDREAAGKPIPAGYKLFRACLAT